MRSDVLVLINADTIRPASLDFPVAPLPPTAGTAVFADGDVDTPLQPGEVRILKCRQTQPISGGAVALSRPWAEMTRIAVEAVEPGDTFPAKTVVGRDFIVSADIFGDGHDVLAGDLLWQSVDQSAANQDDWQRIPMRKLLNDRWEARISPKRIGLYRFAVEAWWDQWATFTHDLHAKVAAGQNVTLEVQEGQQLIQAALHRSDVGTTAELMLSDELTAAMKRADPRPFASRSTVYSVRVDRPAAEYASWYELFPRSATHDATVHGTFRSVVERLPDIRAMGFDVLYFPPINPIGRVNRKGRNNALRAEPGDVGALTQSAAPREGMMRPIPTWVPWMISER